MGSTHFTPYYLPLGLLLSLLPLYLSIYLSHSTHHRLLSPQLCFTLYCISIRCPLSPSISLLLVYLIFLPSSPYQSRKHFYSCYLSISLHSCLFSTLSVFPTILIFAFSDLSYLFFLISILLYLYFRSFPCYLFQMLLHLSLSLYL
jgi:hypothetical protein